MTTPDNLLANHETEPQPRILIIFMTEAGPGAGVSTQAKLLSDILHAPMVYAGGKRRAQLTQAGAMSDKTDEQGLLDGLQDHTPKDTEQIEAQVTADIETLVKQGHQVIIVDMKNPLGINLTDLQAEAIGFIFSADQLTRALRISNRSDRETTPTQEQLADIIATSFLRSQTQLEKFSEAFPDIDLPKNLWELEDFYISKGFHRIDAEGSIDQVHQLLRSTLTQIVADQPHLQQLLHHQSHHPQA